MNQPQHDKVDSPKGVIAALDPREHIVARTRPVRTLGLVAALVAALATSHVLAANAVPAQFQGGWVPANAACESPVRVQVGASNLTLVNGSDKQPLGGIEIAGPGYFPPGYRGIEAVLITEFDGHQPATMTFNAGEKKGVAQIEFAQVTPGSTPALKVLNAHYTKLNLAKRFPLNKVSLKKCG
jgi:hypothetical protein